MQSKEIRRIKKAIRRIKRINKENVRLFNWVKFKIKRLEEELTSKKKWATMYPKLIRDGRVLEQKARRLAKNGNKSRT